VIWWGGGLSTYPGGIVTVSDASFSGNRCDTGGAIYSNCGDSYTPSILNVSRSTVTGYVATQWGGGAIGTCGTAVLSNSTFQVMLLVHSRKVQPSTRRASFQCRSRMPQQRFTVLIGAGTTRTSLGKGFGNRPAKSRERQHLFFRIGVRRAKNGAFCDEHRSDFVAYDPREALGPAVDRYARSRTDEFFSKATTQQHGAPLPTLIP
jgi:predicted outer membrane repeat protein